MEIEELETREVEHHALAHQYRVLTSQKPFIFMGGGVGCGKTDVGSFWVFNKVQQTPEGSFGLICANTYTQLIDSTLNNLYKNYKKFGIKVKPLEPPKAHKAFSIYVYNQQGWWIEIKCRSLEKYETLSGIETPWWWADEVFMTRQAAIDVLDARLRDTSMPNQALMTTTLDDPSTWMYERFHTNVDHKVTEVIYASTYDNKHNLPDGYIDRLKSNYSKQLYKRMVLCKWVTLDAEMVYYAFGRSYNVDESVEYDKRLPICWTHDFNIGVGKPASSALCQIKKMTNFLGEVELGLIVFDEIIMETSDTNDVIKEFQSRYPNKEEYTIIYGDASGSSRDTRSKTTDYQILNDAGFVEQRVPKKNPPIRERHNNMNRLLLDSRGVTRVLIHPRCKVLIKGLETVKLKKGAQYLEVETYDQHVTTALGYFANEELPMVSNDKYKPQDVPMGS